MNERLSGADSRFKWYRHPLPWLDRSEWLLPAGEEMAKASFDDVDPTIAQYLEHQPGDRRGLCIQAGGCFGLFPLRFLRSFENVLTFEPHPLNWMCLTSNTFTDRLGSQLRCINAGLSDKPGAAEVVYPKPVLNSYGAHYLRKAKHGTVECVTIDETIKNMGFPRVDHMQLDIEGAELSALKGAISTIKTDYPVIVLEQRSFKHATGVPFAGQTFLLSLGYRLVDKIGHDRIFVHENH
jgi:FkbM family methyltransferase